MKAEINIWVVLAILAIHWFADFVLQTDKQAKGKSKNWHDLLSHTAIYSTIWIWGIAIIWRVEGTFESDILFWYSLLFALTTFICHTITDYFTSRLNSKLWEQGKVHLFFVSIGFDQLLHFVQLLLTYQLLS